MSLSRRFPQFELRDDHVGLLESQAGFLDPEKAIAAFVEGALRTGCADVHAHEAVERWTETSVQTNRASYHAERIIFCGGAWSGQLLRDLGVKLVVTRQVMGWVWPREPEMFEYGRLPVWAIDHPQGGLYYGFPMMRDGAAPGFKLALHRPGAATDPDRVSRETSATDEESFRDCLTRFIPKADGPLLAMRTCLYTNSPDSHFIIDRHPQHDSVLLACGFSGHGFKFASVIGEALADLAVRNRTDLPVGFLRLDRFSRARE
jgi:sarcosine oxidase